MQYPKDDIQEDILKAAGKVFLEKGFPKTSMREIAEEAQVGLERFKEEFTERSTALVKEYFRDMKKKHPQMNVNVTDFSIHLHTAWMFTMFEELLMHRVAEEDLEKIVTEYITFEVTGWRELMKI